MRGGCISAVYVDINKGLWPKPIKIGPKGSRVPLDEAETTVAARIAGKPDDEIRALVQSLHAQRQANFAALTGAPA